MNNKRANSVKVIGYKQPIATLPNDETIIGGGYISKEYINPKIRESAEAIVEQLKKKKIVARKGKKLM